MGKKGEWKSRTWKIRAVTQARTRRSRACHSTQQSRNVRCVNSAMAHSIKSMRAARQRAEEMGRAEEMIGHWVFWMYWIVTGSKPHYSKWHWINYMDSTGDAECDDAQRMYRVIQKESKSFIILSESAISAAFMHMKDLKALMLMLTLLAILKRKKPNPSHTLSQRKLI